MEDAEDSAAGPPQYTCFVKLSVKHSQWLATLRKRKQWSQCTYEWSQVGKNTRESAKGEHIGESLHKPGMNYAHIQP